MLSQQNKTIIENYYRYIRELYIQLELIQLHESSGRMKAEVLAELKELHNKLSITYLMGDRSLLAITGLQGTGKSTIIKRLYQLPEDLLPENSGRGERLPVFIKEKNINQIETYVYRLTKNAADELTVKPEHVGMMEFKEIALNPAANQDLWLECVVPERYLKDESKSIVLLPGFEKDDGDLSQLLLEHILYLAHSTVLVLRKDTFARESTQKMMHKVKNIYQNVKPVVAITFGDVSPHENEAFKQQMLEKFAIPELEGERVVITGEKPKFNENWEEQLMNAIDVYGYSSLADDRLITGLIEKLVKKTEVLLSKVSKMLGQELTQKQMSKYKDERYQDRRSVVANFENEYSTVLKELEEQIEAVLQQRIEPARTELHHYLAQTQKWPKQLKAKFFGQKPQELYDFEKKIQEIWDQPQAEDSQFAEKNNPACLPANVEILKVVTNYLTHYGKVVINSLEESKEGTTAKLENKRNAFFEAISAKKSTPAKTLMKKKNEPALPLERIDTFFAAKDELPLTLERSDYQTLAVIGTMFIQETYVAEADFFKNDGVKNTVNPGLLQQASMEIDVMKNLENLSQAAPKVLKSIPVILGFDGLIDGELDLLTNATAALGSIGIKLTSGQLLGLIGAGFAATYAAKAIQDSMIKANERQLQLAQAGERVFRELPSLQAKAFTNSLGRIFERMSKQLLDKHLELTGYYDSIGEVEQLQYLVRKIHLLGKDIKRGQYEQTLLL